LREGKFPAPSEHRATGVLIVGGGMAGLSSARRLEKLAKRPGFESVGDFQLLELEGEVGGNSRSGQSEAGSYPWGAHYVPLPSKEAKEIRELFEELGVITGYDSKGRPRYDEYALCSDPQERLLMHGRWSEGLVPQVGLRQSDREQIHRFHEMMEGFATARGNDGRRAFAIPIDRSSRDPKLLELDRLSFSEFLKREGFDSNALDWYVGYCCRDDYGTEPDQVSAWAGIHYFASRGGDAANADAGTVLTWPEGNGWIVNRLREPLESRIHCGALVFNVEERDGKVIVDQFDVKTQRTIRWTAASAILATPLFVSQRIFKPWREDAPEYVKGLTYAPWVVAQLTVREAPRDGEVALAWDNVSFHSQSLGYINSAHQNLDSRPGRTVLTFYKALSDGDPKTVRQAMMKRDLDSWRAEVLGEMERMHSGITESVEQVDVWLWGHAMARPRPGLVWGYDRDALKAPHGRVVFAHADLSGISIFEEAYTHGVRAGEQAAKLALKARLA
jgi:protoporphyrinogen oxidase